MKMLLIASHAPYDGTDVTWNALRLAGVLAAGGDDVRLFVMNDAIDIVRESVTAPGGSFDLLQMTKDLIAEGVTVRACGTCLERSGTRPGDPAIGGVHVSDLNDLSTWIRESDRVITF